MTGDKISLSFVKRILLKDLTAYYVKYIQEI